MPLRTTIARRTGAACFLFFLAKGIVWLAIAAAAALGPNLL